MSNHKIRKTTVESISIISREWILSQKISLYCVYRVTFVRRKSAMSAEKKCYRNWNNWISRIAHTFQITFIACYVFLAHAKYAKCRQSTHTRPSNPIFKSMFSQVLIMFWPGDTVASKFLLFWFMLVIHHWMRHRFQISLRTMCCESI